MLQAGDLVPHFEVHTIDGAPVAYRSVWQKQNVLLVTLPAQVSAEARQYVDELTSRASEFAAYDTALFVTSDVVAGLPRPGVLVADRWGEIAYAEGGAHVTDLPAADELLDWTRHVQHRCPECEGEAQ